MTSDSFSVLDAINSGADSLQAIIRVVSFKTTPGILRGHIVRLIDHGFIKNDLHSKLLFFNKPRRITRRGCFVKPIKITQKAKTYLAER